MTNVPGRGVDDRLLVGHLGEGQGVLEGRRLAWRSGPESGKDEQQVEHHGHYQVTAVVGNRQYVAAG